MKKKSGRRAQVINSTGDKGEHPGGPDLAPTYLNLKALPNTRHAVDKGIWWRGKLPGHEHGHRNHTNNCPAADQFDILNIEDRGNDKNQWEMKKVRANP